MIPFKKPLLSDREWAVPILEASGALGSEYSFGNIFNWGAAYSSAICRINDYYVAFYSSVSAPFYLCPVGTGDIAPVIEAVIEDARQRNIPLKIRGVTNNIKENLEQIFPDKFVFSPTRDSFDYIDSAKKLTELSGKDLHPKRTHINKFNATFPQWSYEPITPDNIGECSKMHDLWLEKNAAFKDSSISLETVSLKSAINNFSALHLEGGLIRIDGNVAAFTIGEHYRKNAFIINFEKALPEYALAYAAINQTFAKHNFSDIEYVNREDDLGVPGLRQAKLSYRPEFLIEKYSVSLA